MHSLFSLPLSLSLITLVTSSPYVFSPSTKISYHGINTSPGIEAFLGIPYGKIPLRFAAPEPIRIANGTVINARVKGKACPQSVNGGFAYNSNLPFDEQSEDCLNLKVVRPVGGGNGTGLPVIVYIYGGGLSSGFSDERTTAPDGLITESVLNGTPVIFVAMNYRLNIFGFAATEALRGTQSLNAGVKDQRLALQWIQENIALFGGDPSNVMIFGQSSGALSVTMQILAYGGSKTPLFHRAAIHSTALEPTMNSNIPFTTYNGVATLSGCANSSIDAQSAETLSCLRALPWLELYNYSSTQASFSSSQNDGDIYFPTVDNDFLPLPASELVRMGNFTKMPVMIGWQEDDAALFTPRTISSMNDTEAFVALYWPSLNESITTQLLSLYPSSSFISNTSANLSSEFYRSAQIFRDILLTCPSFYFSGSMARKFENDINAPVYIFSGNQTILTSYLDSIGDTGLGVTHTSDLAYVYGNLSLFNVSSTADVYAPDEGDFALAKEMARSWSSFAWYGKPGAGSGMLKGWEVAYGGEVGGGGAEGVEGARVFVVGGPKGGMSDLVGEGASEAVKIQQLADRCGFLNRMDVISQLEY